MARLEPQGRVIRVSASGEEVVDRITVREGQDVAEGQSLAVLQLHSVREAERRAAEARLARHELDELTLEKQRAELRLREQELTIEREELARQDELRRIGLVSESDHARARLKVLQGEHEQERQRRELERLTRELPLARREAEAEARRAQAEVERSIVRAPTAGRVLKILARPGERLGAEGLLQLGRTSRMYAVAEVHANDVRLVRAGQKASFTSPALPGLLHGAVEEVGALIHRNDVFGEDPTAPENVRVFEVRVGLADSAAAAGYTNLEGQVRIELKPAP